MIARSDGSPLYNLCAAVDDDAMGITHVVRGDEHVSNTLCQAMLLDALGCELPIYAHCALVLDADRKKLSKRRRQDHNGLYAGSTVAAMRADGVTPLGLATYLASLGFAPSASYGESPREVYDSLDELALTFDLERVNAAPAAYDPAKLRWLDARCFSQLDRDCRVQLIADQLDRLGMPLPSRIVEFCADELFGADPVTAHDIARRACDALAYDETELRNRLDDENVPLTLVVKELVEAHAAGALPTPDGTDGARGRWDAWLATCAERTQLPRRTLMPALRFALTTAPRGPDLARQLELVALAAEAGVPSVLPIPARIACLASRMLRN